MDGILIEMPWESKKANEIGGSIYMALRLALKGKPFNVYNHDVKLRTGNKWEYAIYTSLTDSFDIRTLGITVQVADVYEGVF